MSCPNCGSKDVWDDQSAWGCNKCDWCSLAGLNKTRTPSNPGNAYEVSRRAYDWAEKDAEENRP